MIDWNFAAFRLKLAAKRGAPVSPQRQAPVASPCHQRRAFSLVELLIVVVIIGIIAAMAVPRFGQTMGRFRVDAAAQRVSLDLALARNNAIDKSITQTVTFDVDDNSYELVGMPDPDHPAQSYVAKLSGEPYNALITYAAFGGSPNLVFDLYGVPAAGGSVLVNVGGEFRRITVADDTGRATIGIYVPPGNQTTVPIDPGGLEPDGTGATQI